MEFVEYGGGYGGRNHGSDNARERRHGYYKMPRNGRRQRSGKRGMFAYRLRVRRKKRLAYERKPQSGVAKAEHCKGLVQIRRSYKNDFVYHWRRYGNLEQDRA